MYSRTFDTYKKPRSEGRNLRKFLKSLMIGRYIVFIVLRRSGKIRYAVRQLRRLGAKIRRLGPRQSYAFVGYTTYGRKPKWIKEVISRGASTIKVKIPLKTQSKKIISVDLRSEGCNDLARHPGCGRAYIMVNGRDISRHCPGHNLAILDYKTGQVQIITAFDSHNKRAGILIKRLFKSLIRKRQRKIVLISVQGNGAQHIRPALKMLRRAGGYRIRRDYRGSYVLCGYLNLARAPKWSKQVQNPRRKGPSLLSVKIPLGVIGPKRFPKPKPRPAKLVSILQNKRRKLRCRRGYYINIVYATYGRRIRLPRCYPKNVLRTVRRICERKRTCTLKASNRVFGNPSGSAVKVLKVFYRCRRIVSPKPKPRPLPRPLPGKSLPLPVGKRILVKIVVRGLGRRGMRRGRQKGKGTKIEINGRNYGSARRGVRVVYVDFNSGRVLSKDTIAEKTARFALYRLLKRLRRHGEKKIVIIASRRSIILTRRLQYLIQSLSGKRIGGRILKGPVAMILYTGKGKRPSWVKVLKNQYVIKFRSFIRLPTYNRRVITVDIRSEKGSKRYRRKPYSKTYIAVNGVRFSPGPRDRGGFNCLVVDEISGRIVGERSFDIRRSSRKAVLYLKEQLRSSSRLIVLVAVHNMAARRDRELQKYLKKIGGPRVRKLYRSSLAIAGYNKFRVSYRGRRRFLYPYWVKWVQYNVRSGPSILSVRIPLYTGPQPRPRPRPLPRPRPQPWPQPRPRPLPWRQPRPYPLPRPLPRPRLIRPFRPPRAPHTVSGCDATADIAFLVDGSKDIGRTNFELEKRFIKAIVKRFPVSQHQSHIGVRTYGAKTKFGFKFGDNNRALSVLRMIQKVPYPKSRSRNLAAFARAAYLDFFAKRPYPSYVHRALVVLVGGHQSKGKKNFHLLRLWRRLLLRKQVYIYLVLIGKVDTRYVSSLALNPKKHVFPVHSFKSLISNARRIGRAICEEMKYSPDLLRRGMISQKLKEKGDQKQADHST